MDQPPVNCFASGELASSCRLCFALMQGRKVSGLAHVRERRHHINGHCSVMSRYDQGATSHLFNWKLNYFLGMPKEKVAVIIVSYTNRHLEKNPGEPRCRLKVLKEKRARRAMLGQKACKDEFGKKFKRVLQSGGDEPRFFDRSYEAYCYVQKKLETEASLGREISFEDPLGSSVYIMQMTPLVKDYKPFIDANGQSLVHQAESCCYVGLTSDPVVERYQEHTDPNDRKRTNWGLDFFVRPFDKAYRVDLLEKFRLESGFETEGLTNMEAHIIEGELTFWLRGKGIAAYFN